MNVVWALVWAIVWMIIGSVIGIVIVYRLGEWAVRNDLVITDEDKLGKKLDKVFDNIKKKPNDR